jgi:hypothetical protein
MTVGFVWNAVLASAWKLLKQYVCTALHSNPFKYRMIDLYPDPVASGGDKPAKEKPEEQEITWEARLLPLPAAP